MFSLIALLTTSSGIYYTCEDFTYQYQAQAAYYQGHTYLDGYDGSWDGVACSYLP